MTTRTDEYAAMSRRLLEQGQEALRQGDLVQASEKLWGAAAQMVKSVAERRGWQHGSHRELFQITTRLAQESGDTRLIELFQFASSLRTNFYDNWLPGDVVEIGVGQVQEFISKLERI